MRGSSVLLPSRFKFKPLYPVRLSHGRIGTITKKLENNVSKEGENVGSCKADPIVAFSKPPQLPPFLGPLVALAFTETWSSRDGDDK